MKKECKRGRGTLSLVGGHVTHQMVVDFVLVASECVLDMSEGDGNERERWDFLVTTYDMQDFWLV